VAVAAEGSAGAEGDIAPAAQTMPVRAALPFLSAAAAALVVAEINKLGLPGVAGLPNSVHADFRFGLPAVMSLSLGTGQLSAAGYGGLEFLDQVRRRVGRMKRRRLRTR
jgi:hypothetical protein